MSETLPRLVTLTRRFLRDRGGPEVPIDERCSVCQDLLIFGIDVDEYIGVLEDEFGKVVREVPWGRYTDQTASFRGVGCLAFPSWLFWRLLRWPFSAGPVIPRPDPRRHPDWLPLAHLASVIDLGRWFEPETAR